jgi:DnaJ domain
MIHKPGGVRSSATCSASYYDVLNVAPTSSIVVVKDAYHALIKQCHPDKQIFNRSDDKQNDDANRNATYDFVQIQTAWECLRDPTARRIYDETLHQQQQELYKEEKIIRQQKQNSVKIYLSECRCSISSADCCLRDKQESSIEFTDSDGYDSAAVVVLDWIYQCRCGYDLYVAQSCKNEESFLLSSTGGSCSIGQTHDLGQLPPTWEVHDMEMNYSSEIDESNSFLQCVGCSLLYDISPLFIEESNPDDS